MFTITDEADVVIVGAGPAGASMAAHCARRGLSAILLEKASFPRDKVCGDGLTPRATKALTRLGIDTSEDAGWLHNYGLRVYGDRPEPWLYPWPELHEYPNYGLTRRRMEFDEMLVRHAEVQGATVYENTPIAEPVIDTRTHRVTGVRAKDGRTFSAPVVVAADGNSSRISVAMGLPRDESRPMGVAVRAYFRSPRHDEHWMESWLQLWDGEPGNSNLLPGYGWLFPLGDGTVNVGLGMLNTSEAFQSTNYRDLLRRWTAAMPDEWGFTPENQEGGIGGAALPMAMNRKPVYARGLMLLGDAAGLVSPFNGEGISSAMESAELAADAVLDARSRGFGTPQAERALEGYTTHLEELLGGYYRLGIVFANLIGNPTVMKICTRYGLPRKNLMKLVSKLLAGLYDTRDGDLSDKIITGLSRMVLSA